MTTKERLTLKLMHLAYLVHTQTHYCVFISFSGHVDFLGLSIRESKDNWQERVLEAELYAQYKKLDGMAPKERELAANVAVLEAILNDGEIPFDDLDYEEEYSRHYTF